jgi:hypothetical protein
MGQHNTQDETFPSRSFVTIDDQLLFVIDRGLVVFTPLRKLVQFLRDALRGDIGQEKGNGYEAGFWLSIPLDDKDVAIAGHPVQHFARGTSQFHHFQRLEIDFQSNSR